jgi:16S rRNA (adenine1518-N6/adenine1519-N6)-dimethyltransferase
VDSAVVAIDFEETVPYPATAESFLFDLVRAGFGKRRKMLKNALKDMHLPLSESEMQAAFAEAGIDARRRAETLRVQEFVNLSNALTHRK